MPKPDITDTTDIPESGMGNWLMRPAAGAAGSRGQFGGEDRPRKPRPPPRPSGRARGRIHKDERVLHRALTSLSRLTGVDFNHKNHGRVLDV